MNCNQPSAATFFLLSFLTGLTVLTYPVVEISCICICYPSPPDLPSLLVVHVCFIFRRTEPKREVFAPPIPGRLFFLWVTWSWVIFQGLCHGIFWSSVPQGLSPHTLSPPFFFFRAQSNFSRAAPTTYPPPPVIFSPEVPESYVFVFFEYPPPLLVPVPSLVREAPHCLCSPFLCLLTISFFPDSFPHPPPDPFLLTSPPYARTVRVNFPGRRGHSSFSFRPAPTHALFTPEPTLSVSAPFKARSHRLGTISFRVTS